jgi:hypothetical protein
MAYMRRTLRVIHFASQFCGISPYIWFLRNGGYEKPVPSRKYLFYSFILFIGISVIQFRFAIGLLRESARVNSEALRINYQILFSMIACILTTYVVSAVTRLIGKCKFFKICRKLLSVSSFLNYQESANFSNTVIAIHVVLFFTYLIQYFFHWTINEFRLNLLHFFISSFMCETVTSFAAIQSLYFVSTLRRLFMSLNSRLHVTVVSTVKSKEVRTVLDFLPEKYSVISGLREIRNHHVMLCDVLDLINSSYSLPVLALISLRFIFTTLGLYLVFFSILYPSAYSIHFYSSLPPVISFEVTQLVAVLYCCKCASFQVGTI